MAGVVVVGVEEPGRGQMGEVEEGDEEGCGREEVVEE